MVDAGQGVTERPLIANVAVDETRALRDGLAPADRQVIDDGDSAAGGKQLPRQMGADEARSTGHQGVCERGHDAC